MRDKQGIADNIRRAAHWLHARATPGRLVIASLIITTIVLGFVFSEYLRLLREPIHAHPYLGIGLFIGVLVLITLFPVVSSLPLLPVAGAVWGLFMGSIYATLGWWIGGLIAFAIARLFRRPVLERYISVRKLDAWQDKIPDDISFRGIIFARILLPPGVPSYVVGLMHHISLARFALATLIGGIPMAFLLVGLGSAMASGSPVIFVAYSLGIVALLLGAYLGLWRRWKEETRAD